LAEKYEATIGYCLSTAVLNWGCEKGLLGVWTFLIIQKQYIKCCKGCKNYFTCGRGVGLNELRTAAFAYDLVSLLTILW